MKRRRTFLIIAAIGILISIQSADVLGKAKRIEVLKIQSEALKTSRVGENTEQKIVVYLPPSYGESKKHYPVVYYLHGFDEDPSELISYTRDFDDAMTDGREFIIVAVNGRNKLNGCFYVNSPAIGNWEDFIIREVVSFIDSKYRTIPKTESRGIAGYSMGGFGAINLGLKHPDIFSSIYGLCPGLFDENGLKDAIATWDSTVMSAYGAAFSPNPEESGPLSNAPKFNNTEADHAVVMNWENGYGNLRGKIEAYLKLKKPLRAFMIEYGKSDYYRWIPKGCVYFSKLLTENNIPHELVPFSGGHDLPRVGEGLAPFFVKNLQFSGK